MKGAVLKGAVLKGAVLKGAVLKGAVLKGAVLKTLSFITGLVLALWLIAVSFMVVLSAPVTHVLADMTVDTSGSIHSHEYLVSIAEAARAFSLGDDAAPIPQGTDDRIAFTPDVIGHLLDVRGVFIAAIVFFWVITTATIVVLVLNVLVMRSSKLVKHAANYTTAANAVNDTVSCKTAENPLDVSGIKLYVKVRRRLGFALIAAGCFPLSLCIVFALIGLLAFDALFAWMHGIFFTEGSWQFSYDSLLIRALPQDFWMGCAAVWAVTLVILCLLSIGIGILIRRSYRKSMPT